MHGRTAHLGALQYRRRQICARHRQLPALLSGHPHKIIGIHDARSLAEGHNRAVQKSRGELLLFSHDDVEIVSGDLAPAIARASASLDVIGGRRDAVGVSAEIAVIHASGGTFGDAGSVTPPGSPKSTATSFQPRSVAPSGRSRGCWWHRRRRSCASFRLSA
ncbi:MAG: hypothetical protein E6H68_12830 [Betaproteobacteria bacterium]|nr:MAG: hypothetical protein E6H68_12830 [Betaproteobacteria bacterium]